MFIGILKKVVPVPRLTEYSKYVFVGPHPDDIEVSSGGTVAELVRRGKQITFIVATNGCVGSLDPSLTEERLIEIRKEEALRSAKLLGVNDVIFLPFDDGWGYDVREMSAALAGELLKLRPDVVFCPDHTVRSECHPDHVKVGQAVTDACFVLPWEKLTRRLGLKGTANSPVLAYYYTDRPNAYVPVTKTYKQHLEAIACHKSQFAQAELNTFRSYFSMRERRFGLRCGRIRAEGFRALSPTHQHCFPEAAEF